MKTKLDLARSGRDRNWQIRDGILCKLIGDTFCPVIPPDDVDLLHVVLADYHSAALGGHLGAKKLLKKVSKKFYFLNLAVAIDKFVKQCTTC